MPLCLVLTVWSSLLFALKLVLFFLGGRSNQLSFPFPAHPLDLDLSAHRTAPVRLLLRVHQPHRAPGARVAGTCSAVMLAEAPLRVGRPAGVISPIRTFKDIAITRHGNGRCDQSASVFLGRRLNSLSRPPICCFNISPILGISCPRNSTASQSPFARSNCHWARPRHACSKRA
jgi:hypothetical protein